jgi:chromosomal replication initiator protein
MTQSAQAEIIAHMSKLSRAVKRTVPRSEYLLEQVKAKKAARNSATFILDTVCNYCKMDIGRVKEKTRKASVVNVRQIAMYVLREHSYLSLVEIGDTFGGYDHTTIIHTVKVVKRKMEENSDYKEDIQNIINILNQTV